MRAVAVPRFRDAPELMELPEPKAGPDEVLVRVEFAGVNPLDWKVVDGLYEGKRRHVFPLVLGVDGAGSVEAVGPSVERFRVGDRVFGQFLHDPVGTGTYVDLTPVPATIGIARIPAELPFDLAAALPTAGMTALLGVNALNLAPGATLVVVGASGGVGSFATELAVARGIQVIAVARPSSATRLLSVGASEVVDGSVEDPPSAVARTHPSGVDALLDTMSDRASFARWARLVRRGGFAVTSTFSADVQSLARDGVHAENLNLEPSPTLLEGVAREVTEHRLPVPVEKRVHLADAPAALAELKAGRGRGKTVVQVRS